MSATSDTSRITSGTTFRMMSSEMEERIGMLLAALGTVVAVAAAIFYLVLALNWRGQPFIGAMLTHTMTIDGSLPLSAGTWTGLKAGLQRGDQIVGVNGAALPSDFDAASQEYETLIRSLTVGQTIKIDFERPAPDGTVKLNHAEVCGAVTDGFARCEVSFILTSYPDLDFLASFIVPFVSGLITLGIGIAILMLRKRSL
ncbi:MAG TPA: hypothetical protein VHD90_06030, partial [Phototrophicaceae bacterium]|nr:hypothetical protein [Phototrophicaceae bacterium]